MSGLMGGGDPISSSEPRIGALRVQTSAYGMCIPIVYGTQRISANMIWYGDFTPIAKTTTQSAGGKGGSVDTQNTTYTYTAAFMLGLCEGAIVGVDRIWKGKDLLTDRTVVSDGVSTVESPMTQLNLELALGALSQPVWGHLTTYHPTQALNYPFLAHLRSGEYALGSSPSLENHSFEVKTQSSVGLDDTDPYDVVYDLLTNQRYGAGYPSSKIADLSVFSDYCRAANLLISPAYTDQRPAHEMIKEIVDAVNCAIVPSGGKIKILPYGDEALSGNSRTYTPNITPVYDLTDDDFIGNDEPVRVSRKRDADAFNHVQIEYGNRANQYNVETVEAKDQANIELFGLRSEDAKKLHLFCDPTIAQHAAQLRLQRVLYVRNQYEFDLGWRYCLLEPMDIVTLTDEGLGLNQFPVRITAIKEDANGMLTVTAEEFVQGAGSAVVYSNQSSGGYSGSNEEPGSVYAPVIFEPPLDLTGGTNQAWCAVAGGADWGGCDVWASYDNATYTQIGTIYGPARYGTLVSAIDADDTTITAQLNTNSQILGGTTLDAETNETLCYIGGEYVSYVGSTLVSGGYQLSGCLRGRFGGASGHIAGAAFARLDRAIFVHDVKESQIGQTIYLKFLSFNGLLKKRQTLDVVETYSYTLSGGKPSGPSNLSLRSPFVGTSFDVQWSAVTGATSYKVEIVADGAVRRMMTVTSTSVSYTLEQSKADGGPWRGYTVRVASVSGGITSAYAELNISNPVPVAVSNVVTTSTAMTLTISWDASTVPDLKDYQVWLSTTSGFDPDAVAASWTGIETSHVFSGLTPLTTYYLRVAARDFWGVGALDYTVQFAQATAA